MMMTLKLRFVTLFLFSFCVLSSQGPIPLEVIHASSEKVDIRVGPDYYAKEAWHLDSSVKPDIFRIGSKWNYESLEVSFITDLDSITFNVKPGNKYDFVIMLNEDSECYIRIITSSNPVFMNWETLILLIIIFSIIIFLLSRISKTKHIMYLLSFGLLAPTLFWLISFVAGRIQGDYEHSRNVISELGALGTNGEIFTSISFVVISICSLIFSIGFYKASNKLNISKIPSILSFIKPISLLWASIFPLGNEFHGLLGASPLLLIVGALVGKFKWKRKSSFINISNWSLVSALIMLLIFLRFIEPFGQEFEGLIQRFFYLGWTIWFFVLSIKLTKKMKTAIQSYGL